MSKVLLVVATMCLMPFIASANSLPMDSIGVENYGGKLYIIHRVDPLETLYSIARRYKVKVEDIQAKNPELGAKLSVGTILRIPMSQPGAESGAIMHEVGEGETLYAISRKYGVKPADIKQWNNLQSNNLNIGQRLKIKITEKSNTAATTTVPSGDAQNNNSSNRSNVNGEQDNTTKGKNGVKTHVVRPQQTLYSISRMYGVTVDEILKMNGMSNNNIKPGQELIVGKEKVAVQSDEPTVGKVENQQPATTDPVNEETVKPSNPELPANERGENTVKANEDVPANTRTREVNFKEIEASGLAEMMEGTDDTRKYLALHKTASVGTIIRVRNEMNNREVFVRVLGKLPDTGVNDNVLIKISKPAYEQLGAIDKRFRVHISYIP